MINRIFKSNSIADINVSFYIINLFWFFNEFLTSIKKYIIKIEKKNIIIKLIWNDNDKN